MADEKYSPTYRFAGDGGHLVFGNDRALVPLSGPDADLRVLDDREFAILRGLMQLAADRMAAEALRRGVAEASERLGL